MSSLAKVVLEILNGTHDSKVLLGTELEGVSPLFETRWGEESGLVEVRFRPQGVI